MHILPLQPCLSLESFFYNSKFKTKRLHQKSSLNIFANIQVPKEHQGYMNIQDLTAMKQFKHKTRCITSNMSAGRWHIRSFWT